MENGFRALLQNVESSILWVATKSNGGKLELIRTDDSNLFLEPFLPSKTLAIWAIAPLDPCSHWPLVVGALGP